MYKEVRYNGRNEPTYKTPRICQDMRELLFSVILICFHQAPERSGSRKVTEWRSAGRGNTGWGESQTEALSTHFNKTFIT